MVKEKTINVSEELWRKMYNEKLDSGLRSLEEVIINLYKKVEGKKK